MGTRLFSERFWQKVDRGGTAPAVLGTPCWEWTGALSRDGYGYFVTDGRGGSVRRARAHRVAWELENGPIPDEMFVCHRCDNRRCVRADHLFLGTNAANTADRHAKGRDAKGARNGMALHRGARTVGDKHWTRQRPQDRLRGVAHGTAKLDDDKVRAMRTRYAAGDKQRSLAVAFGVSQDTVHNVVTRKTWAHVDDATDGTKCL